MSTAKVPTGVKTSSGSDGVRGVFKDVTNLVKFDESKGGKVKIYKKSSISSQFLSGASNSITKKRDAILPRSMPAKILKDISRKHSKEPETVNLSLIPAKTVPAGFDLGKLSPENDLIQLDTPVTPPIVRSSIYQHIGSFHDIDARDADDELLVTDYVESMFKHLREQEHRAIINIKYINAQPEMTARMRAILIDWLTLVCLKAKLSPEVIFIAVNIMDRFLSIKKATKKNLQLIGATSLFVASKYEDIYPVPANDLVYLCDNSYTLKQIYKMEEKILKTLNYQISLPTSYKFLLRFLNAAHADRQIVYLASYIMEETLLSIELMKYRPSEIAAGAVFIARKAVGRNCWSSTLSKYTEYPEEYIIRVARSIMKAKVILSPGLRAIEKKYSQEKKMSVASIPLPTSF